MSVAGPGVKELFVFINLAVVVAIIYFAGRKSISAAIKGNSKSVEDKLASTKKELALITQNLKTAAENLAQIEEKKAQLLSEIKEQGEKLKQDMVEDARKSAANIMKTAKLASENELRQASSLLRQKVVKEAMAQVKAALNEDVARKAHVKLVEEFSEGGHANGQT